MYKKLADVPTTTSKDDLKSMLRAAVFLIRRAIKDKVSSVSNCNVLIHNVDSTRPINVKVDQKGQSAKLKGFTHK